MKHYLTITIILLSITTFSCTERIDVRLDDSFKRLVVEGSVTTDIMKHRIILSETSDYFYNNPPVMVSGADVTISDGTSLEVLTEDSEGVYVTGSSFAGIPGKTYTLNITLENPVGGFRDYTASSKLMPVASFDSITLAYHDEWGPYGIWEVKSFFPDPPTNDYYRILISVNSRMLTDTLYEWYVTDDIFFNGNNTNGIGIGYLVQGYHDNSVTEGDTIIAEINGIGKDYASFIMEAQTEIWGSNPLFSGPSANIVGNISNGAIGFFAAYSVSRASVIVPSTK
jgi:hypothetical protein